MQPDRSLRVWTAAVSTDVFAKAPGRFPSMIQKMLSPPLVVWADWSHRASYRCGLLRRMVVGIGAESQLSLKQQRVVGVACLEFGVSKLTPIPRAKPSSRTTEDSSPVCRACIRPTRAVSKRAASSTLRADEPAAICKVESFLG